MLMRYSFSLLEGDAGNPALLGEAGANLCRLAQFGVNTPPGFVISTSACTRYWSLRALPDDFGLELRGRIGELEQATGKQFGGEEPLLLTLQPGSARLDAAPGPAIFYVGFNTQTVAELLELTDDPCFVFAAYQRFIQSFGVWVFGVPEFKFAALREKIKRGAGVNSDAALSSEQWQRICELFLQLALQESGQAIPEDGFRQLELAVAALFGQPAAGGRGEAVAVLMSVFGDMGDDCAVGEAWTRRPDSGQNLICGDYWVNAPERATDLGLRSAKPLPEMADDMPQPYRQLQLLKTKLESCYQEVQYFRYVIERGVLYCMQTCHARLQPGAMVKTSIDMVKEGLISREQAILRLHPQGLEQLLHPQLALETAPAPLAQGVPASPGVVCGQCAFDAAGARRLAKTGAPVIFIREQARPEDRAGFMAARGAVIGDGGKTSFAAVMARGMGKSCVVGVKNLAVDATARRATVGDLPIREGDWLTIDGGGGRIYAGKLPVTSPAAGENLKIILAWADEVATLPVYANADSPELARQAVANGAKGIGLYRTERMFIAADRLPSFLEALLSDDAGQRQLALTRLLPLLREEFLELFEAMSPRPVTVRLFDAPTREYLPSQRQLQEEIAALEHYLAAMKGRRLALDALGQPDAPGFEALSADKVADVLRQKQSILSQVAALYEVNPMLGQRGVRLALAYPEIYLTQIRAMFEAAARCLKQRMPVNLEVMAPQVVCEQELSRVSGMIASVLEEVEDQFRLKLPFSFGAMVETVRACACADSLAEHVQFFSFGANDLTQAVFSFSREDAEHKFLPLYQEAGILPENPFETLDIQGLGKLMRMAVDLGRRRRPDLRIGICGEQGGHPDSIRFCLALGLDYVSCSAPRIPIARLAAAQARLLAPRD